MENNYHGHTYRCHHAQGKDELYVLDAIEGGFKSIGFTDHVMLFNFKEDRVRASFDEKQEYYDSIKNLKEKYKDKIKIYLGFECEYNDILVDYYKQLKEEVDYLIFGNHYTKVGINEDNKYYFYTDYDTFLDDYLENAKKAMESKLFLIFAHPDQYLSNYPWNEKTEFIAREICKVAKENNIYLEINGANVLRNNLKVICGEVRYTYPTIEFFRIAAEYKNKVILNLDCHAPQAYLNKTGIFELEKFARKAGVEVYTSIPELENGK